MKGRARDPRRRPKRTYEGESIRGMADYMDQFAKGAIAVKFLRVEPVTPNRKRNIILGIALFLFLPVSFLSMVLVAKYTDHVLIHVLILIGWWCAYEITTRRWLFKIKPTGLISFSATEISIASHAGNELLKIPYGTIKGIRYQQNVPRTVMTKHGDPKTYIIEFLHWEGPSLVIEAMVEIHYTSEDQLKFRSFDPSLKSVLETIQSKYGTEPAGKIKTPLTIFPE